MKKRGVGIVCFIWKHIDSMLIVSALMGHDIDHGTQYANKLIYNLSSAQEGKLVWN